MVSSYFIFFLSILFSIVTIFIEREIGIDWDFHPDAVTYVSISDDVAEGIIDNPLHIINNAHYLWVSFLGSSTNIVVALNIFFWGITNTIIYNSLAEKLRIRDSSFLWLVFILFLFSPYRLHLSTTMLKDTIVILLLTCSFVVKNKWLPLTLLLTWRAAAIFYLINLLTRKIFIFAVFMGLLVLTVNFDFVSQYAAGHDQANMQFRDFDTVPPFKEYEFVGILLRMLLWPIFALTGFYALISPSIFFFPLAIGSIASLTLYCLISKKFNFFSLGQILFTMALFAFFATGFTSYIRYVYPIISIIPIILLYHEYKIKK